MNIQGAKPASLPPLSPDLIAKFRAIVGDKYAVTDASKISRLTSPRSAIFFTASSPLVLRPGTTAEVSDICKLASAHKIALVPQGGNTGLVGGQTPHNGEVVVSLRRLDKIREVDAASNTMTCEAGVVLQVAQQRAAETSTGCFRCRSGRKEAAPSAAISPPMLAARQRFGVWRRARDGARAGSGAGRRADPEFGLSKLKKDNTGYDLRNLFIGAEGTLGIITAATLKLFPKAARDRDRLCRPRIAGAGAEAVVDRAERGRRQPDQF